MSFSKGESIRLLNVPLKDGRQAAAVFTSPQRAGEAFGEVGCVGIQGRILFEMIRATPAVLNPGQVFGVVWEPESLSALLGLAAERVVQKDTKILLGSPAEPPTELIGRLRSAFAAVPGIEAAWLALAAWPESQSESWYLDVRAPETERETIRLALPKAIEGADMLGRHLDIVINPIGQNHGVGIALVGPPARPAPVKKSLLGRLFG